MSFSAPAQPDNEEGDRGFLIENGGPHKVERLAPQEGYHQLQSPDADRPLKPPNGYHGSARNHRESMKPSYLDPQLERGMRLQGGQAMSS